MILRRIEELGIWVFGFYFMSSLLEYLFNNVDCGDFFWDEVCYVILISGNIVNICV